MPTTSKRGEEWQSGRLLVANPFIPHGNVATTRRETPLDVLTTHSLNPVEDAIISYVHNETARHHGIIWLIDVARFRHYAKAP